MKMESMVSCSPDMGGAESRKDEWAKEEGRVPRLTFTG
jgi:hypothetical protein